MIRGLRRRWRRLRARGDAGFTLADLLVSMTIMAVVMAVFTQGMLEMYSATNKTLNVTTAQAEINRTYLRLDRSIRYAAVLSNPSIAVTDNRNVYIQYLTTAEDPDVCHQLRLNVAEKALQYRWWPLNTTISLTTGWQYLVTNVVWVENAPPPPLPAPPPPALPFTFDAETSYQRMRLYIVTKIPGTQTSAQTDITFTALNSDNDTPPNTTCNQNRPA